MTTFKQFFQRQELNESKAIMFPPEVQDKLYDIANKMIPALMHLAKKEQPKDYSFYILIDTIEFDDPYLNKKRTYDVYAVRTGSHEKNKNSGGWQDAFKERPQIVVTTNIVFPELEKNQKWLDSLPEGTIEKILMNIVYNNKEIILEKIYNTLSHELGHAYDPTLSKGYRYKTGSPEEYIEKISDPDRIECQHSMYSIVQYSKFKWLKQAIEENPFNSKFFFWIDAGGSRFFDEYNLSENYPSLNALDALNGMGDKFLIQMNMEYYKDLANADTLSEEYLFDNRSYVLGSMFGGTTSSLLKVSNDVEDILLNKMIANGFVNNEQIALGYLVKQNPDDFEIFERYDGKHMALFTELGKQ